MSEETVVTPVEETPVEETPVVEEQLSEVKAAARRKEVIQMGGGAVACVNCEKRSYPAETIYFEQVPYHVDCFKCVKCVKKIDGTFNAAQFEHKLYCRRCFQHDGLNRLQAQVKWTPKSGTSTASSGAFSHLGGGSTPCTICTKACYPAETVSFEGKAYHGNCLACSECRTGCTLNNVAQFEDRLYCNKCWTKNGFNRKQIESAKKWEKKEGNYSDITLKLGGGSIPCTVCTKACYPAETISFEGKPYHTNCLACSECRTGCTLNTVAQFEDHLYCNKCWTKNGFNRKQIESAQKWEKKEGNYSDITLKLGGGSIPCTVCTKACYPAETVSFEGKPYHNNCLACSECRTGCTLNNVAQFEDNLYCNKCWTKNGFNRKQVESAQKWVPKESTAASGAFAKFGGGGSKCDVCEKTVYPAEALSYESRLYHPKCFNCTHCQQRIPTVNNAEHKGPVPYCKRCFTQLELWRADK